MFVFVFVCVQIIEVLQEGAQNRQVGGTNMNAESSRSHAVFIIDITQEIIDFEVLSLSYL